MSISDSVTAQIKEAMPIKSLFGCVHFVVSAPRSSLL